MDEGIEKLLYGLFAILFWIVPMILRARSKKRRDAGVSPELPAPSWEEPSSPVPVSIEDNAGGQFDGMIERATRGAERAEVLLEACERSGGPGADLIPVIRQHLTLPLSRADDRLRRRSPGDTMMKSGMSDIGRELGQLEQRLRFVEEVVARRAAVSDQAGLAAMDRAVQDLVSPFSVHAQRLELPVYPLAEVVIPVGLEGFTDPLPTSDLSAFQIDVQTFDRPEDWPLLARECAATFLGTLPNSVGSITSQLGLPEPGRAMASFYASGRLTTDTLLAGWMSHMLPDVVATVQMGPSYPRSLVRRLTLDGVETVPAASVDRRLVLGPPPDHLRVFAACAALGLMGFDAEGNEIWSGWEEQSGAPAQLILSTGRFPIMPLPLTVLTTEIGELVTRLLDTPLSSLGGYSIPSVPDLACDSARAARMRSAARDLREGIGLELEPRTVVGAASLAAGRDDVLESRIARVARQSLVSGGAQESGSPAVVDSGPSSLAEAFHAEGFLPRAVVVGAIFSSSRWRSAG